MFSTRGSSHGLGRRPPRPSRQAGSRRAFRRQRPGQRHDAGRAGDHGVSVPGLSPTRAMRLRVLVSVVVLPLLLASCGEPPSDEAAPAPRGRVPVTTPTTALNRPRRGPRRKPRRTATSRPTIETSAGTLTSTMDAEATPCTVGNFVSLAEQGYFDSTTCHRLTTVGIFVLQCGDPTGSGMGGPGYTIPDELDRGRDLSGRHAGDGQESQPDSGGSQFFMVYDDTEQLEPEYAVFGTLDEASLEAVREVAAEGTAEGGPDGDQDPPWRSSRSRSARARPQRSLPRRGRRRTRPARRGPPSG